jgi:sugar lactone lactonase YvrE
VLVGREGTIETTHRGAVTDALGEPAGDLLVAMDGKRTIYAAVNRLHAVCLFKFTGEYANRFGSEGKEPGQLAGLMAGLTADGQGNVFVSDALGVSVFLSKDGRFRRRLEIPGAGLAVGDDDELFVANGKEVVRYPPQGKEED